FYPARSAADFAKARKADKIASFIVIEGGVGLENSLGPLRVWHTAGARMLIPCHNETLDWVDSATDAPRHNGFNAFGRAVIAECNRLGMIVDGAHVSHTGIRMLLDVSEAPVFLSHSNAYSLCDHPRNAPDDVLKRLKDNGGLVMATFVPGFVSQPLRDWLKRSRDAYGKAPLASDPKAQLKEIETRHGAAPKARLEEVADHVVYLVETAGLDHVGIGSDFFGGPQPLGLEHVGRFPHLVAELMKRGFSEADIAKIANGNALRTMRAVEKVGRSCARRASRWSAGWRIFRAREARSGRKNLLHEHQIEPAAEFAADLVEMRGLSEAELAVEAQRTRIVGVDRADHDMHAGLARQIEQMPHQRRAEPQPARGFADMHAVLDAVPIARKRAAPLAVGGKAQDLAAALGDDRRKARRLARMQPVGAFF